MQQERLRRPNRQRTQETRNALIAACRRLLLAKPYSATGTPEIVATAGVTRGALYHHFTDKQALLRAVIEAESAAVAAEIERAAPAALAPVEALLRGGDAFLAAMAMPGRTRLLLLEGPAVLGRAAMDEIDARYGGRTLREGLTAAISAGALPPLEVNALAALLSAAFDRAALAVDGGADPADYRNALSALILGLTRTSRTSDDGSGRPA